LYTFYIEQLTGIATMHYERLEEHDTGLILPTYLGSTIVQTKFDPEGKAAKSSLRIPPYNIVISSATDMTAQIERAKKAAEAPRHANVGELVASSTSAWHQLLNSLVEYGEIPVSATTDLESITQERQNPDNLTRSGLLLVTEPLEKINAFTTQVEQEFAGWRATPDEIEHIESITSGVQNIIGTQQNPGPGYGNYA
jgi:hypothetical protein